MPSDLEQTLQVVKTTMGAGVRRTRLGKEATTKKRMRVKEVLMHSSARALMARWRKSIGGEGDAQ